MKFVLPVIGALALAGIVGPVSAADIEAGKAKASVCMSCHRKDGATLGAAIPNLGGQKEGYIAKHLQAFKDGSRKDPLRSAFATQLDDKDIANLAPFRK